jgi:hypothetical protein
MLAGRTEVTAQSTLSRSSEVERGESYRWKAASAVCLALAATISAGTGCSKASAGDVPALAKSEPLVAPPAAPAFASSASPGVVPCGAVTCPATKSARRACCNAPGVPPMCRNADRCGQATKFRYSGMLACNETADCTAIDPGRDVVCCLTDDGFKAEGVGGPYNRAACMPRAACASTDAIACVSDAECPKGKHCRTVSMGVGIDVGACMP